MSYGGCRAPLGSTPTDRVGNARCGYFALLGQRLLGLLAPYRLSKWN